MADADYETRLHMARGPPARRLATRVEERYTSLLEAI